MNSHEYWKKREKAKLLIYQQEEKLVQRQINDIYNKALQNIQREIDSFYLKYAIEEKITLAEAKKRVSQLDINEYSRKARLYVKTHDMSKQANTEMKLYNLTMKINRLEMLKAKIGLELIEASESVNKLMQKSLLKRCLDEFKTQAGILGKSVPDPYRSARAIVESTIGSATFSERIWFHMSQLKDAVSQLITRGLIQGRNPNVLARDLRKSFDVTKAQAERLMRTEMARAQIQADEDLYKENGYRQFEFIANHNDGKTCDECSKIDGKIFKFKDLEIGKNAPPMHPNCRCAIAPYMSREVFDRWLDMQVTKKKKFK